jgi:hypothetical protein
LAAHADRRVVELPFLTDADWAGIRHLRTTTTSAGPAVALLHEMFEAQAAKTPRGGGALSRRRYRGVR